MANAQIRYRRGYKYQLVDEHSVKVDLKPDARIETEFIDLNTEGELVIKRGYAWDGASGPARDTKNIMRASLVHDALYQLMRQELLPMERWRKAADLELKRICREDGMSWIRAWWVHLGVRRWGALAASPESRKKKHTAP
jgi:hypothetical protein